MDLTTIQSNSLIFNGFISLSLIVLGIFLGKSVSYLLSKLGEKLDIGKKIRPSFLGLIITLIRWSIYLIFINFALLQFPTLNITNITANVLLAIPFFLGAIMLIVFGFIIANYIKEVINEAQINGGKFISLYLFYFVIFVTGIYALRIALFSFKDSILNYLLMMISTVFVISIAYKLFKNN